MYLSLVNLSGVNVWDTISLLVDAFQTVKPMDK